MHAAVIQAMSTSNARLSVTSPIRWKPKDSALEFQISLRNDFGQPLILGAVVLLSGKGSVWVRNDLDRTSHVARLCLRGSHRNKRPGNRLRWEKRSHLHRWNTVDKDALATDPVSPPWPPENWSEDRHSPLSPAVVKRAVYVFCRMHGIDFADDYWVDSPELPTTTHIVTSTGEEVP